MQIHNFCYSFVLCLRGKRGPHVAAKTSIHQTFDPLIFVAAEAENVRNLEQGARQQRNSELKKTVTERNRSHQSR